MLTETVKAVARECGFELAGVAGAAEVRDYARYERWVKNGYAGEMRYLTDRRGPLRRDVRELLAAARSVICVGKLYNTPEPAERGAKISRYAWGTGDYHEVMRTGMERMVETLLAVEPFEYKICVDTAPLLERSLAREAGLGWIGKNTCLIHEPAGSWFFLGAILTSLELTPGAPPPERCGSCTACIDACPTQALVHDGAGGWALDARRCVSYLTIEYRGEIPAEFHTGIGEHVFGCDVCQEVCPWNRRAPVTDEVPFQPVPVAIEEIEAMTEEGFRQRFGKSPVARTKLAGLRRNAAIASAMAATASETGRSPLTVKAE